MDIQQIEAIKRDLRELERRLKHEREQHEKFGTLDGEARLVARDGEIEIARLKEKIAHAQDPDSERHSTDAADLAALRTQLDYWTARIDRAFKVRD